MSPTIRLRGRREPAGARPVRVHVRGVGDRRQLVFAAAYVRRLLARTTGPIEIVVSTGSARGGNALSSGDITRALPEDPLVSYVRRTDPRRRGTRTVLLSMDGAPLGAYLRLLGAERRRAWVVVWDSLTPEEAPDPPQRQRAAAMLAGAARPARSAKNAVLTNQHWALAARDRKEPSGWRLNSDAVAEFRRIVNRSGTPRRAAVYLAAAWPSRPEAQEALLAEVDWVRQACASTGLALHVRPASEADARFYADYPVLDASGPAELDPRVVDAALVVGAPSLALLHVAAVHGVPAIALQPEGVSATKGRRRSCFDALVPTRLSARDLGPQLVRPSH